VVFGLLLLAFLAAELRNPHAMMPLGFFRIPAFSAGNTVAFAVSLGMFATFFFLSLYMQLIHLYSPFEAGVRFLPMTLAIVVTAPAAGRFAQQHGSRAPMTYGLLLSGGGLLLLGMSLQSDSAYLYMLPIFVIMGHGMGATMAPMTAAVMNAVGQHRAGMGSAMTNTSREVGGVLGIALLGTILTTKLKGTLMPALVGLGLTPAHQQALADAASHGTLDPSLLAGLSPDQAIGVQLAFGRAFMDGFHVALTFGGIILLVAAAVANRWIPSGTAALEHAEAEVETVVAEI
jgi:predicted MFS family arabinose efflux permease